LSAEKGDRHPPFKENRLWFYDMVVVLKTEQKKVKNFKILNICYNVKKN